jgi:hypothetical protein
MVLSCPVCGEKLAPFGQALKCPNGHSFDVARQHYVNLLLNGAPKEKRHGDDRGHGVRQDGIPERRVLRRGFGMPFARPRRNFCPAAPGL